MARVGEMQSGIAGEGQKRIAILTVSLSGHKRPAIAIATEMAERGFAVDFLIGSNGVTDELHTLARDFPNLTLHAIAAGKDPLAHMDWQSVAASTGRLFGSKCQLFKSITETFSDMDSFIEQWRGFKEVLEACPPDLVVLDHAHKIMQQWAEEQGIPSVVMHTPYYQTGPATGCAVVSDQEGQFLGQLIGELQPFKRMDEAKAALGITGEDITLGEGEEGASAALGLKPHTFVFCEPELLHTAQLPQRVHAVGPCFNSKDKMDVDANLRDWIDSEGQVLYVAFGTLANGFLTAAAVGTLIDAFYSLGSGWRVLWSLPKAQQPLLQECGRSIDNARLRVEPFVRQRAVLAHPNVKVFLTHGGQTSVNEGLAAGRPLVCMPLFCDQYEMAESIYRHGLGLVFHKDELLDKQADRLRSFILRVDQEPSFKKMAARHARLMRIRHGCARAAEVLESIIEVGADYQELWQSEDAVEEIDAAVTFPEPVKADKNATKGFWKALQKVWGGKIEMVKA